MIQEGFAVFPLKGYFENVIFCFAIIMLKLDNVRMRHTYISCLLTVGVFSLNSLNTSRKNNPWAIMRLKIFFENMDIQSWCYRSPTRDCAREFSTREISWNQVILSVSFLGIYIFNYFESFRFSGNSAFSLNSIIICTQKRT